MSPLQTSISCVILKNVQSKPPEVLCKKGVWAATLAQMFSCEFCEIFKNTFITEHLWRLLLKRSLRISLLSKETRKKQKSQYLEISNLLFWKLSKVSRYYTERNTEQPENKLKQSEGIKVIQELKVLYL